MSVFLGCYNKSVLLTYLGAIFSLLGMFFIKDISFAMICLILAGLCDLFDGKVARLCKRTDLEKSFGIQIDSLVDVLSFLVFPVVILHQLYIYSFTNLSVNSIFVILGVICYILAGITRLAWFNITTDGSTTYYKGLPVTYIAFILPVCFVLFQKSIYLNPFILFIFYIVSFLFVLNIPIKKPAGIWYILFSLFAVFLIAFFVYNRCRYGI